MSLNLLDHFKDDTLEQPTAPQVDEPVQTDLQPAQEADGTQAVSTPAAPPLNNLDKKVIDAAAKGSNGTVFNDLMNGKLSKYKSWFAAVMALLGMLAYWTCKVADQMDRIFRNSGLMRPEWDAPDKYIQGQTMGQVAIACAIENTTSVNTEAFSLDAEELIIHMPNGDVKLTDFHPERVRAGVYGWNDRGTAELFMDIYKEELRKVPERNEWYVYDGKVWKPGDEAAKELLKDFCLALDNYARKLPLPQDPKTDTTRADFIKFTTTLQRQDVRNKVFKDASSIHPIKMSEFDKNPHILNVRNGELNLKNGNLNPHNPESLLAKMANVSYDPNARSPLWERHIDAVCCGDAGLKIYIQKVFGYALTGTTNYECFFILYGPTSRNGKSTTIDTIIAMLGDYAESASPESIAQKITPNGSGPSADIARLAGARIVNFSEPDQKMKLNNALVKMMTGNNPIVARFMYGSPFAYKPAFKMFIDTNHLPYIDDPTLFQSNRIKVLPFTARFIDQNQDNHLKEKLLSPESLSGILNWCIEGWQMLENDGFKEPQLVVDATAEYARVSDKVGQFIEEILDKDDTLDKDDAPDKDVPKKELPTEAVYDKYRQWCLDNGQVSESQKNFKLKMEAHGIKVCRKRPDDKRLGANARMMFIGIDWAQTPAPSYVLAGINGGSES